jgi:hypothetical protein
MGFLAPVALDLDARPILEVVVPECEATWNLALKIGGSDIPVAVEQRSGTHRVDLRAVVGRAGPVEGEIIFRVRGRTVLDAVRFLPGAPGSNTGALTGAAPQAPVAVVVRFPFDAPHARVMLRNGATVLPGTATLHDGPPRWAELRAKLTGRTVVRVEPAPPAQLR